MKKLFTATCLALVVGGAIYAVNPPTMGWSSWNTFALDISEDLIKSQADAMVSTGLADAGYKFINIDDGYTNGRAADGTLIVNTQRFPNGMRAVADYIHSRGLKAGIYSDAGDNTCGSRNVEPYGLGVGFFGHEQADAKLYFDEWDYDFIKVDFCGGFHVPVNEREQYTKIVDAIRSCDKQGIVFNICRWAFPGTWAHGIADSWRTTGDIDDSWGALTRIIHENLYIQAFTRDGHYNDCDMLEIGRTMTPEEENTHMAYWCITSSPLLIGCDMTNIPARSLELMKNRDLIAMNQDRLAIGAPVVQRQGEVFVVAKDMNKKMDKRRAVVAMNLSDETQMIPISIEALGFEGPVRIYDCFTHKYYPAYAEGSFAATIPAHGSLAWYVTGKRCEKKTYQAEEAWMEAYQEIAFDPTAGLLFSDAADGGVAITQLGNREDNFIEWPEVYSKHGGKYNLVIRYACAEPRSMTLSINGNELLCTEPMSTGNDTDVWSEIIVPVELKKGFNSIRLSNPSAWMPNIDYISITPAS